MSRWQKLYQEQVVPALKKQFGYTSNLAVPKISKVVINVGVGDRAVKNKKALEKVMANVTRICGQALVKTYAHKAISGFGVRENQIVGLKVTLRRERMDDFLDKLVSVTLPRVRDFRGLSLKSFDKQGNYTIGFKEQTIFPEIKTDEVEETHGLEVCINTTAKTDQEALSLLKLLGFPFKKK